jgi:hypothetical protein
VPNGECVFSHEWCGIVKYKPNQTILFLIFLLFFSGGGLLHKDEASDVHN